MDRDHLPVFVFNIDGLPADQAGALLDVEHDVITRTGLHCAPRVHDGIGTFEEDGTVRFSPGVFTTDSDVERAINAVADIASTVGSAGSGPPRRSPRRPENSGDRGRNDSHGTPAASAFPS
jgi:hypothetical protein